MITNIRYSASIFVSLLICVSCSKVPAVLWNIQGSAQFLPVSAFDAETRSLSNILDNFNDGSTGVVVFLVDKISMEDLATQSHDDSNSTVRILESFLDQHPYAIYPSVRNPEKHLRGAACGVEDIYMTPNMEGRLQKALSEALKHACLVVVHLPHNSALGDSKPLFSSKIFQPDVKSPWKNVIGIFTAKTSSWESAEKPDHKSRGLLSVDVDKEHLINETCIVMYAENITVLTGSEGNTTANLVFPPQSLGDCKNISELTLTFTESEPITTAVFNFMFEKFASSWKMTSATVILTGADVPKEEINLEGDVGAPGNFSFSCGQLVLRSDKNATVPVTVLFEGFQIEYAEEVGDRFANSFNCVHWFTLPIWMGTFIVLFFVTILNVGVYHIFQAKTMDRFDDPKGKTLTVPQTE